MSHENKGYQPIIIKNDKHNTFINVEPLINLVNDVSDGRMEYIAGMIDIAIRHIALSEEIPDVTNKNLVLRNMFLIKDAFEACIEFKGR